MIMNFFQIYLLIVFFIRFFSIYGKNIYIYEVADMKCSKFILSIFHKGKFKNLQIKKKKP